MKPTKIINTGLQKPWLLIAVYESMFDTCLSLKLQLRKSINAVRNNGRLATWQTKARVEILKDAIKQTSDCLREKDEQIHNYIKTHQQ